MAIGLRKKSFEVPDEEPTNTHEAEAKTAAPILDAEWQEADPDPFMLDVPDERIAPAPAAARPARPGKPAGGKGRKTRRNAVLTYAPYVLLFVTVASLSAAIVLVFA